MAHGIGECVFCNNQATSTVEIEHVDTQDHYSLPVCDACSGAFMLDGASDKRDEKLLN